MKVQIKSFDVNVNVKSKGIEFEVRTPDGSSQIGDCYVTMTGIIWCKGRTQKNNGTKIGWDELASILQTQASKNKAVAAVQSE